MPITRIIITLEIEGNPADAWRVVNQALDDGAIQNAINEHETDAGPLSCLSALASPAGEP